MCKHCYVVKRGKVRYVYCKMHPKHKQRQGFHTMSNIHNRSGNCCLNGTCTEIPGLLSTTPTASTIGAPTIFSFRSTSSFISLRNFVTAHPASTNASNLNLNSLGHDNISQTIPTLAMQGKLNERQPLPSTQIVGTPLSAKYIPEVGIYSILQ